MRGALQMLRVFADIVTCSFTYFEATVSFNSVNSMH